jgi:hypothetical protein
LKCFASLRGAFADDGFVVLDGFYGPEAIFEITAKVTRFLAEILPSLPRERVQFENT